MSSLGCDRGSQWYLALTFSSFACLIDSVLVPREAVELDATNNNPRLQSFQLASFDVFQQEEMSHRNISRTTTTTVS